MSAIIFSINKNINKPIEFKGLKAQYIWWLAGGLVLLLFVFVILYFLGINSVVCLAIVGICGAVLFFKIYAFNRKYGEHGMMKMIARKRVPRVVKSRSRRVFVDLKARFR